MVGTERCLHLRVVEHSLTRGPESGDERGAGSALPKPADQVPQVRRRSRQLQAGHGDDLDVRQIQLRDRLTRDERVRDCSGRNTLPGQQLRQHCRDHIIERAAASNARDHAPVGPQYRRRVIRAGRAFCVDMLFQIADDGEYGPRDFADTLGADRAASLVAGGELQRRQHNTVVIVDERPVREQLLRLVESLVRVVGEHALVEAVDFRQSRPVAQQDVKELERL